MRNWDGECYIRDDTPIANNTSCLALSFASLLSFVREEEMVETCLPSPVRLFLVRCKITYNPAEVTP